MADDELRATGLTPGTYGWFATKAIVCPRCAAPAGARCAGAGVGDVIGLFATHTHGDRITAYLQKQAQDGMRDSTPAVGATGEAVVEEKVDHPAHYGGRGNTYEAIKVIEAWDLGFCTGNAVKYISRAGRKPGSSKLEDLAKARWYLDREIARLEAK